MYGETSDICVMKSVMIEDLKHGYDLDYLLRFGGLCVGARNKLCLVHYEAVAL